MGKRIICLVVIGLLTAVFANAASYDDYVKEGNTAFHAGKIDDAIKSYTSAIQIEPKREGKIYNLRGVLYRQQGKYDLAIKDFTKAIGLDSANAEMYLNNRGNTYGQKGDFKNASKDFSEVIKLNPKSGDAYTARGKALLYMDQYAEAVKDLTSAIEINPGSGEAYKLRAMAYEQWGKKSKARADREKAKSLGIEMKGTH